MADTELGFSLPCQKEKGSGCGLKTGFWVEQKSLLPRLTAITRLFTRKGTNVAMIQIYDHTNKHRILYDGCDMGKKYRLQTKDPETGHWKSQVWFDTYGEAKRYWVNAGHEEHDD